MKEQQKIDILKLKNGEMIIGTVDFDTDIAVFIMSALVVEIIEMTDYHGIGFVPLIPLGYEDSIPIKKAEILFQIEASSIMKQIYLDKIAEVDSNNERFVNQYLTNKIKEKEQVYN